LLARIRRSLGALVLVAVAMIPLSAAADVSPSPTLAQVMLPAPSGYTAQTSSALSGSFSSNNLSSTWGAKAPEAQKALEQDGFVDGYGITVVDLTARHALIEYIVAFAGGQGAMDWLSFAAAGDKADPTYQHADSMSGIGTYYGEHNVYPSHDVSDDFAFVKGNDFFVVGFESTQDDVLNLAIRRAKNQYDSAPDSTIPPAQWPENFRSPTPNATSQDTATALGGLIGDVLILAVVVGLIVAVVALVRRSRPRPTAPDGGNWSAVQLSPDGGYWWDGQAWRDATHEVPPTAQRSADLRFWWDGRQWRPVR
jgi:hypothetical protein